MLSKSESQWIQVLNRGIGWNQQGRFKEGHELIKEAYAHIPEIAGLAYAEALARSGNWWAAFPLHEHYRPSKRWFKITDYPEWHGEPIEGKHLVLFSEGGFGDALMCVRFIPRLERMGITVTLAAWPSQIALFEKQQWISSSQIGTSSSTDYWASLSSLPYLLGINQQNCWDGPYIEANGENGGLIGVCLEAGAKLDGIDLRSMPKEKQDFLLSNLRGYVYLTEKNISLKNWLDTARLIAKCERVISVDTAVAHLAGAMGKPVDLMLGQWSDWKWGENGEKTHWYPSFTIHRNWDLRKLLDSVAINALEGVA